MTYFFSTPWTAVFWVALVAAILFFGTWYAFFRKGHVYWPPPRDLSGISPETLIELAHDFVKWRLGLIVRDTRWIDQSTLQIVGASTEPAEATVLIHVVHRPPHKRVKIDPIARLFAFAEGREAWLLTNTSFSWEARHTWMSKDLRLVTGKQLSTLEEMYREPDDPSDDRLLGSVQRRGELRSNPGQTLTR